MATIRSSLHIALVRSASVSCLYGLIMSDEPAVPGFVRKNSLPGLAVVSYPLQVFTKSP